jgi:hypothetical protein
METKMETKKETSGCAEQVIRRTISRPGEKKAGLYVYLGEPSKAVLERVSGEIGKFIKDFNGKINATDFIHGSAGKICECDCFCSCSCDCTCNCDCVCYCDCNCPCLCQSACNDYLKLVEIEDIAAEMTVLRERLATRFGQINDIVGALKRL